MLGRDACTLRRIGAVANAAAGVLYLESVSPWTAN
jgi:hypothetical protein